MNNTQIRIGGHMLARPKDLAYLKGDANCTHIHYSNRSKVMVATTLKILEVRFAKFGFYRTFKNSLVNLQKIKKWTVLETHFLSI